MRLRLLVCGLALLPVAGLVQGCGGGGGGSSISTSPTPSSATFAGNYTGSSRVTAGPGVGETSTFALTINSDGQVSGSVLDSNGNRAALTGTLNASSGNITANGNFADGTTIAASGRLTRSGATVTGTGTFQVGNGNSGPLTIRKS